MSIVAVHGPNTMFTTEGGGQSDRRPRVAAWRRPPRARPTGWSFNFSVPNPGARPAADFDWTFTGPGTPAAQPDKHSGTVTFTGAGAVTIVCTVAAGAGPPAGWHLHRHRHGDGGRRRGRCRQAAKRASTEPEPEGEYDRRPAVTTRPRTRWPRSRSTSRSTPTRSSEILELEEAGKNRVDPASTYLEALIGRRVTSASYRDISRRTRRANQTAPAS